MHITPRLEGVLVKSYNVLICCGPWLSDGWIERTVLQQNKGALWHFAQK